TRIMEEMRAAHLTGAAEAGLKADVDLHNAIGECAHNIILLHTLRACYRLLSGGIDRKSTRLNSSHVKISYAVFCLKKKNSVQPMGGRGLARARRNQRGRWRTLRATRHRLPRPRVRPQRSRRPPGPDRQRRPDQVRQ